MPIDPRRFRGLNPILSTLERAGKATPANLDLLFGKASNVAGMLMELRLHMSAALAGSPADLAGMGPSSPQKW